MKIAIIGRTETLYNTAELIIKRGHEIVCIITAKEAAEYLKKQEDFAQLASLIGVPFASTSQILVLKDVIESVKADIGVSMNYTGIIPNSVIKLFPHGILNAHGEICPVICLHTLPIQC